jgi:small subunit ribosomal protein S6
LGPRRPQEVIAINKYELMLIVNPNADEERQKEIVERLRATVEQGDGKIVGIDEQGKKKMQYEIKKETEGVYTVLTFTAKPETLAEVERVLGITDEVLRVMTLRLKS